MLVRIIAEAAEISTRNMPNVGSTLYQMSQRGRLVIAVCYFIQICAELACVKYMVTGRSTADAWPFVASGLSVWSAACPTFAPETIHIERRNSR